MITLCIRLGGKNILGHQNPEKLYYFGQPGMTPYYKKTGCKCFSHLKVRKSLPTLTILMFWCTFLGVGVIQNKPGFGVGLLARCFLKFLPLIMLLSNCSLVFCRTSNDEEENCVSSISAAVALSLHCRWSPAQRLWGHKIRIPRGRAARKQGLNASWWQNLLIASVPSISMEN